MKNVFKKVNQEEAVKRIDNKRYLDLKKFKYQMFEEMVTEYRNVN